jgi:hypothetical protein
MVESHSIILRYTNKQAAGMAAFLSVFSPILGTLTKLETDSLTDSQQGNH